MAVINLTDCGGVTFKVQLIKSLPLKPNSQGLDAINTIRFLIEDTGVGIGKEQIQKIFQPFEQVGNTDKRSEGTGLGLAMSSKIIEMMAGSIQVNSQLNAGSQFWFDLDLPSPSKWESCNIELKTAIAGYEGNQIKILVVDDRWENRSVLVNLLTPLGFEVSEAANAQESLEQVNYVEFHAIITDLVMPGMDGFELVSRLRSQPKLKDLVIIISSASVFEAEQHKSLDVGANAFLAKPVQATELLGLLEKHLGLSWIYQESFQLAQNVNQSVEFDSVSSLVPPPDEELVILYNLVIRGNLKAVIKQLEQLKKLDEKYIPFAEQVGELARSFQEKQLRLFIDNYMKSLN